jgi:hypothetical protein
MRDKRKVAVRGAAMVLLAVAGAGTGIFTSGSQDANARASVVAPAAVKVPNTLSRPGFPRAGKLSTQRAINRYLRSIGISNPRSVVVQRGRWNYAGPNCPGKRWNCTTARRVIQIAPARSTTTAPALARSLLASNGGQNKFECKPEEAQVEPPEELPEGTVACVIVQVAPAGPKVNQQARCTIHIRESGKEFCSITQENNTGGHNMAHVDLNIDDNDDPEQLGDQEVEVNQQTRGDGKNELHVDETIKLSTRDGSNQDQEGYQSALLTQSVLPLPVTDGPDLPATGNNLAHVRQSQNFDATVEKAAASTQTQNTDPVEDPCTGAVLSANVCTNFHQSTGFGKNEFFVDQDEVHTATAKKVPASGVVQEQSCVLFLAKSCGIELDGSQDTDETSKNRTEVNQDGRWTLRAPEGADQTQDPPIGNGPGFQSGGPDDLWKVRQKGVLTALDTALQAHVNSINDSSTGTVDARSEIILNDQRSRVTCEGSSCFYVQACGDLPGEEPFVFCPESEVVTPPTDSIAFAAPPLRK